MSQSADRNLLLGLLALQLNFIERDQLISGMQAWMWAKQRALGDLLIDAGALSTKRRQMLEELVDEHIAQHGGEVQASLAALSSDGGIVEPLQQLADPDVQASLVHLPQPTPSLAGQRSSAAPVSEPSLGGAPELDGNADLETFQPTLAQAPQPSLRFRILREHAKGGMGKVHVALDEELHREVAFKEMLPRFAADPQSKARFLMEAEVTGGLEHPGIVPVYGLGHFSDGRPFYAMRFIRGDSLQTAIEAFHHRAKGQTPRVLSANDFEFSVEFRKLLQRLIDVCNAVGYAHSRKVLHRDLKPGNVMLGKYGETLVVDWGLAKTQGAAEPIERSVEGELPVVPASGSQVAATLAGSALGTPAYMSPEQAAGHLDQMGPATDIYALGAMLFEILTGQPPLSVKELGLGEVLQRVQTGRLPNPRDLVPSVPRALVAVCQKAMSLKVTQRYGSTTELAQELEAWLAGDAVSALREPFVVRARRWARKHPALVSSVTAALLMAAVGLSIGFVVVTGKNSELDAKNDQLDQKNSALTASLAREQMALKQSQTNEARAVKGEAAAKANAELAQRNAQAATQQSELALSTLTKIIFDLSGSLKNLPGGASVRNQLLTTALSQLEQVSTQFASKSAVDRNTMAALMDLAGTILQLGSDVGPPPSVVSDPDAATPPHQTAEGGHPTHSPILTAERLYRRAHEIAQQLATAQLDDPGAQRDLSVSFINLGDVFLQLGRTDDALGQFEAGLKIRRTLAEFDPRDAQKQSDLSILFQRLGDVFLKLGRTEDALAQFESGSKIRRVLAESDPRDAEKQRLLSVSFHKLGDVFLQLGRTDVALAHYETKLKIDRALVESDPKNTVNQRNISISHTKLGDVFLRLGRTEDALRQFEDGMKIARVLAESDPRDAQKQRDLFVSFNKLGDVFLQLGRTDDALAQFESGLKISRVLAEADPRDAQKQRDLSMSFQRLGDVFLKLGRTEDAVAQFESGLKIRRVLAESDPRDAQKQHDLMVSQYKLGEVAVQAGDYAAAQTRFQAGIEVLDRMIANGQNVAPSKNDKQALAGRIQFAQLAALATANWDELLKTDPKELPNLLTTRASLLAQRRQRTEVLQAADKLRELAQKAKIKATGLAALFAFKEPRKHDLLYNAACGYSLSVGLIGAGKQDLTESEQADRKRDIDLALTCLKEAIAAGYDNFKRMRQDPNLQPLRELPEFQALFPNADPAAPPTK